MEEIRADYFGLFNKLCDEQIERSFKGLTKSETERILATLEMLPADQGVRTILDAGCRDGRLTNMLYGKYDVTGLDIGEESLKKVKGRKVAGTIESIPFPDGSFDLSICTEVLEHLPAYVMEKGIAELKRVSRKYLLISVPNEENLVKGSIRCRKCSKVHHQYGHLRSFSKEKLCRLFAGWRPVSIALSGDREANRGMGMPYHMLHYVGKKWADAEVDLCPYCGYRNEEPFEETVASFLIERLIWRLEKIHPVKNLSHLVVLFENIAVEKQ